MRSIRECLLRLTKEEMRQLSLRLGFRPPRASVRKADMAAEIEKAILAEPLNIRLLLRLEEADAVRRAMTGGEGIKGVLRTDEYLYGALMMLEECCLAEETPDGWHIQPCVETAVTFEGDERHEQESYDMIADLAGGLLIHLGMMPLDDLLDRLIALLQVNPEGVEDVRAASMAVMVARFGTQCIYMDDQMRAWFIYEEVDDPDALLARLAAPHVAALDYPDFPPQMLALAACGTRVPGEPELYQPMVDWLARHGADEATIGDALEEFVLLIQNGQRNAALERVMEMVQPGDLKDAQRLADASRQVVNRIPLWDNKGHSAEELYFAVRPRRSAAPMPGRNDPCPCGSGRKYKHCCGKRLQ